MVAPQCCGGAYAPRRLTAENETHTTALQTVLSQSTTHSDEPELSFTTQRYLLPIPP